MLQTVGHDFDEARAKIEATRAALQALFDAQEGDLEPVKEAVARLERIGDEVARVEGVIAGQIVAVSE